MNSKEKRILKKIRKGDVNAFEELFHQYYPGMCSYSESLIQKTEIAEEVVQDVFFNLWKNKRNRNSSYFIPKWKSRFFNDKSFITRNRRTISNSILVLFKTTNPARSTREHQTLWLNSWLQTLVKSEQSFDVINIFSHVTYLLVSTPNMPMH